MTSPIRSAGAAASSAPAPSRAWFALAVLGFTFWFAMAVPFASHREAYMWLARMREPGGAEHFILQSVATFRPIGQGLMWLCYSFLGHEPLPLEPWRELAVQVVVWASFVFAWWLVYRAAAQPRLLALLGLASGAVLFPPYIQLFHPWGLFYTPVLVAVGALAWLSRRASIGGAEIAALVVAAGATVFWHPFASALIAAWLIGRGVQRLLGAVRLPLPLLLVPVLLPVGAAVYVGGGLADPSHPVVDKLLGLVVSYRTIEVNRIASAVSLMLALLTAWSLPIASPVSRMLLGAATGLAGIGLMAAELPVLFAWIALALLKALAGGRWPMAGVLGAAFLLPLGTGIGAPVYGLFAVVAALHVTALDLEAIEARLRRLPAVLPLLAVVAALVLAVVQRSIDLPVVGRLAAPLLAEKERTWQFEQGMQWLRDSPYCAADVAFAESGDSPKASLGNVFDRQHRPPSMIEDVRRFWVTYRCPPRAGQTAGTVVFTFGDQDLPGSELLHELPSRHAGATRLYLRR